MPRGMDERFENPDRDAEEKEAEEADGLLDSKQPKDEELNIREDWDSATIYIEPEQSEALEITFTRLKKQLKRDGHILEKNKHFYRAIFEMALNTHHEETKERVRELVKEEGYS